MAFVGIAEGVAGGEWPAGRRRFCDRPHSGPGSQDR